MHHLNSLQYKKVITKITTEVVLAVVVVVIKSLVKKTDDVTSSEAYHDWL